MDNIKDGLNFYSSYNSFYPNKSTNLLNKNYYFPIKSNFSELMDSVEFNKKIRNEINPIIFGIQNDLTLKCDNEFKKLEELQNKMNKRLDNIEFNSKNVDSKIIDINNDIIKNKEDYELLNSFKENVKELIFKENKNIKLDLIKEFSIKENNLNEQLKSFIKNEIKDGFNKYEILLLNHKKEINNKINEIEKNLKSEFENFINLKINNENYQLNQKILNLEKTCQNLIDENNSKKNEFNNKLNENLVKNNQNYENKITKLKNDLKNIFYKKEEINKNQQILNNKINNLKTEIIKYFANYIKKQEFEKIQKKIELLDSEIERNNKEREYFVNKVEFNQYKNSQKENIFSINNEILKLKQDNILILSNNKNILSMSNDFNNNSIINKNKTLFENRLSILEEMIKEHQLILLDYDKKFLQINDKLENIKI